MLKRIVVIVTGWPYIDDEIFAVRLNISYLMSQVNSVANNDSTVTNDTR